MAVVNCARCKKMFNKIGSNKLCPECVEKGEEEYENVRNFLKENPGTQLADVEENTGVSVSRIKKWIKEGLLEEVTNGMSYLKCEKCGVSISSGKYCDSCNVKVQKDLQDIFGKDHIKEYKKKANVIGVTRR